MQRLYNGVRLLDGKTPSMANVRKIDAGARPMIYRMQRRGLQVDLSHFERMEKELTRDMDQVVEDVHNLTGHYINPGSGDQVADLLFKKLGLKQARPKLTNSGSRESVEDEVLTAIQHDHPVVPRLLEYKEYEKLRGTYVRPIPKLARRTAFGVWRLYPNFRLTRVPSGRLACADPNLLAMPTRTDRGREVRNGFITDPGWVYLSVDESQIEPRLAAHRSQDHNLLRIYRQAEDIYSDFATTAFKLPDKRYKDAATGKWKYPTVDKDQHRRPSKTCVLASFYRVTAEGLLEQMPIVCANCNKEAKLHDCGNFRALWHEGNCQDLLNAFFLRYPGLVRMMMDDDIFVRKNAYCCDMWGRMLHVTAVRSVLEWVVSAALREAGNFPIQSAAQGTIKLTMAQVDDEFEMLGYYDEVCYPLLQVHDELIFECREDVVDEISDHVVSRFETCVRLDVPVKAGAAKAEAWGKLEK